MTKHGKRDRDKRKASSGGGTKAVLPTPVEKIETITPAVAGTCFTYDNLFELYNTPKPIFDYFYGVEQEEYDCYCAFCAFKLDTVDRLRTVRFLVDFTNRIRGRSGDYVGRLLDLLDLNVRNIQSFKNFFREIDITDEEEVEWVFECADILYELIGAVIKSETYKKDPHIILETYAYLLNLNDSSEDFLDDLLNVLYPDQTEETNTAPSVDDDPPIIP